MCWTCGCGDLECPHNEPGHIVTAELQCAADAAGITIPQTVANIVLSLAHFDPGMAKEIHGVDTPYAAVRLVKSNSERRFTLGVAYPALKADAGRAADGFRDFVSPEVLEKTAHEWLHKSADVNLFHSDNPAHQGHFTPAESYIYRGPDWPVDSPVDGKSYWVKAGDWMLGGYWDEYGGQLV